MSKKTKKKPASRNPIARFINQVNKPATHKKKTAYTRRKKHKTRIDTDQSGFSCDTI